MKIVHLYQLARTGRMKHLVLTAEEDVLQTEWWTSKDGVDGKRQLTLDTILGVNIGKSNETDSHEQCLLELDRKVKKKMEEGYRDSEEAAEAAANVSADVTHKFPQEFVPCKPIVKLKKSHDAADGTWLAERKHNGSCIMLHDAEGYKMVYSRRMWDIKAMATVVPEVVDALEMVPNNTLYAAELVAYDANGIEDRDVLKGVTNERTTREKAQKRYDELVEKGYTFRVEIFDVFFHYGIDVTELPFEQRRHLTEVVFDEREIEIFTEDMAERALELGWDGFVLRQADATIEYSMNGKARRAGSYKYVFIKNVDVIVTGATRGKGDNKERYASFNIAQLLPDGALLDSGNAGPGKMGDDWQDGITTKMLQLGYSLEDAVFAREDCFAMEIEYHSRNALNDKGQRCFEFPTFTRERFDKTVDECIYEGVTADA